MDNRPTRIKTDPVEFRFKHIPADGRHGRLSCPA
jgi:hypothetical protein